MDSFQMVIIGSGPGGYVAAIRAAKNGLSTALVEKEPSLGGTCLHRGCIPTKALLHSAGRYDEFRNSAAMGITADNIKLDIRRVHERKNAIVTRLAIGLEMNVTVNTIARVVHAHPTMSEAMMEAAHGVYDEAINI